MADGSGLVNAMRKLRRAYQLRKVYFAGLRKYREDNRQFMLQNFHFADRIDRALFEIAIFAALLNNWLVKIYSPSFNGLLEFCFLRHIFRWNALLPIRGEGYVIYTLPKPYDIEIASPTYEPPVRKVFRPRTGDIVLDVGANIGTHTLMLSRLVGETGKVIAIEPNPTAYRILQNNVTANRMRNVLLEQVACGDKVGQLELHFGNNIGASSGETGVHASEAIPNVMTVEMLPLDELIARLHINRVDWIKIDTEGMERRIMDGARKTIESYHPKLLIEIHKKEHGEFIQEYLTKSGYSTQMLPIHEGTLFATFNADLLNPNLSADVSKVERFRDI